MIQTVRSVIRRWTESSDSVHPLSALVEEHNKIKIGEVAVNPPDLATLARADVVVALPAGTAAAGDLVFVQPPAALEAGLFVTRAWINAADSLTLTIANYLGGNVNGAALNWTYLVVPVKQLAVL